MCLVAYVSGHGFGHSARQIEILGRLPVSIPLVVKSSAPEAFWRREMTRPFDFVPAAFDVGCIQKDSLTVDVPATLRAWQYVNTQNRARWNDETDDLVRRGARLVVTDVASFPLTVAARLGTPGVCVTNFTWADIYADYAAFEPAFVPIVAQLEAEYGQATLNLDTDLSLPMPYFGRRERVGLVARTGTNRRAELLSSIGEVARNKRLALVYLGNWGFPLPYERLETLDDWHFVSLDPSPVPLANWSQIPRDLMAHPDMVASVDGVVSKAGYGLMGECMANGIPLLYPPRLLFAEYTVLHHALSQWAGGIFMPVENFLAADWKPFLDSVPTPGTVPRSAANGGPNAAARLEKLYTGVGI